MYDYRSAHNITKPRNADLRRSTGDRGAKCWVTFVSTKLVINYIFQSVTKGNLHTQLQIWPWHPQGSFLRDAISEIKYTTSANSWVSHSKNMFAVGRRLATNSDMIIVQTVEAAKCHSIGITLYSFTNYHHLHWIGIDRHVLHTLSPIIARCKYRFAACASKVVYYPREILNWSDLCNKGILVRLLRSFVSANEAAEHLYTLAYKWRHSQN